MNVREALFEATNILKKCETGSPATEAGILLCFVIERDKVFLYTHDDYILNENQSAQYKKLIYARGQGTPIQYLTGRQEFMSLMFKVGPEVLIPRQDTEILVETIIELAFHMNKEYLQILDICTGSGCIAISLAHYIKNSKIIASDVSHDALKIAKYNAEHLGLEDRVEFVRSDLFQELTSGIYRDRKYDIIVSNPPYIPTDHIATLQKEVKDYEPMLALNGGNDGLHYYKKIICEAPAFLYSGGFLAFEAGFDQSVPLTELMNNGRFGNIKVVKDIAGIDRVIIGSQPEN